MDRKIHILLIHQAFTGLNEPGGTRHYEFARALAASGHHVTVIASGVSYLTGKARTDDQEVRGLKILRAATLGGLHRSFFHRLMNFISFTLNSLFIGIRIKELDIVWGTSPPIFQAISAWAVARVKRIPFVLEVRDLWPDFAVAVGVLRNNFLIWVSCGLEHFLYRKANEIIVNSPGFIEHIKEKGGNHIHMIPNGSDPAMFNSQADRMTFLKSHGLEGKFVVLYAGAHGLSNDLDVVLGAAEILKGDEIIRIVLLGDGKEKPRLQARAAELNLPNVRFVHPLPKEEIAAALAAADACLAILKPTPFLATVYPNKVFDYMAAGRPVLLAIDGVIRKLIEDSGAGVFVEPGNPEALANAIKELANHPEQNRAMGKAGRAMVEKQFNRSKLAKYMQEILVEAAMAARNRASI
ncbi:MAG: glycosyltransferase family 4 protein [Anaerolineales bacterium]